MAYVPDHKLPGQGANNGLTATGTNQSGALLLTKRVNTFSTVASNTGALLPLAEPGKVIVITNQGANPLSVYPQSSQVIGNLGTNNAATLPAGQMGIFYGDSTLSYQYLIVPTTSVASSTRQTITYSNTFAAGNVVKATSSPGYGLAQANTTANATSIGVIETANSTQFTVVYEGLCNLPSHGFTVGSPLYLSDATPGLLTGTAPTSTSSLLVFQAIPIDANNIVVLTNSQVPINLSKPFDDNQYASASGTNTITATLSPAITAYVTGGTYSLLITNTNTGATTINLNGIGAKNVTSRGAALAGGELLTGQVADFIYDGTNFQLLNTSLLQTYPYPHGECRLNYVGSTQISLVRYKGLGYLIINGALQQIPTGGVNLANTGLTAATQYYVYAYMNSGTMTLEASTTGHTNSNGVEIKTGDATRTLVGWVYMGAGTPGTFVDSAVQRYTKSYFNRLTKALVGASWSGSTTSGSATEFSSSARVAFLLWADEWAKCVIPTWASTNAANATPTNYAMLDTSSLSGSISWNTGSSNTSQAMAVAGATPDGTSEGLHYFTAAGAIGSSQILSSSGNGIIGEVSA